MRKCFLLICLLSLLLLGAAQADEIQVGGNTGLSLTEAVLQAQDGDVLYLAPGEYAAPEEAYPIVVDKAITIIGNEGAVLRMPPFVAGLRITVSGVTVENVRFELLRHGILCAADGMTLRGCSFTLYDAAYRVSSCGVWMMGAYNCTVEDCAFTGCGISVAGPPLTERSKDYPVLTGMCEVGDDPALFTSHVFENNTINGKPLYYITNTPDAVIPSDAGGAIVACCEGVTAAGLDVSDSSMGLQILHCTNVTLTDCSADRCGLFGLYLGYVTDGRIERCTVVETNHGIDMRAVENLLVTDCIATDCEQGIFFSISRNGICTGCTVTGCGNGIFAAVGTENVFTRNLVEGNENGISLEGDANVLVVDNDVRSNTVAGVRVLRTNTELIGNRFSANWVGILAAETDGLLLLENHFVGEQSTALYMTRITNGRLICNTFQEIGKRYIETKGTDLDVLQIGNVFE